MLVEKSHKRNARNAMKKAKKKLNQNTRKNRDKREKEVIRLGIVSALKTIKSMISSIPETHDGFLILSNNDKGYSLPVIAGTQAYLMSGKMDIPRKISAIHMKPKEPTTQDDDYFSNFVAVYCESSRLKSLLLAQNEP